MSLRFAKFVYASGIWSLLAALSVAVIGMASLIIDFRFVASAEWIDLSGKIAFSVAAFLGVVCFGGGVALRCEQIKNHALTNDLFPRWSILALTAVCFFLTHFFAPVVLRGPVGWTASWSSSSSNEVHLGFVRPVAVTGKGPDHFSWEFEGEYRVYAIHKRLRGLPRRDASIAFVGNGNWAGVRYSEVYIQNPNSSDVIVARLDRNDVEVFFE